MEVIGFFKKDTNIIRNGVTTNIDRYISIPAYRELNYPLYPDMAICAMDHQANGQILTSDSAHDTARMVEQASLKYGTYKFEVYSDAGNEARGVAKLSDDSLGKLKTMNYVLLLSIIISVTMSIPSRIRKDYYRFGI